MTASSPFAQGDSVGVYTTYVMAYWPLLAVMAYWTLLVVLAVTGRNGILAIMEYLP
jgi:hypothetical protein